MVNADELPLTRSLSFLQVIIITNSDDGWVKYSCERYLPQLLSVMEQYRVVSARTNYERFYPQQPLCWKAAAFAHEVNETFDSSIDDDGTTSLESTDVSSDDSSTDEPSSNQHSQTPVSLPSRREIISFGDSTEERAAVRIVSEQLNAVPKSVMFVQTPTPSQIVGQLVMVTDYMQYVCEHRTTLDLEIDAEQAEQCAKMHLEKKEIHLTDHMLSERITDASC